MWLAIGLLALLASPAALLGSVLLAYPAFCLLAKRLHDFGHRARLAFLLVAAPFVFVTVWSTVAALQMAQVQFGQGPVSAALGYGLRYLPWPLCIGVLGAAVWIAWHPSDPGPNRYGRVPREEPTARILGLLAWRGRIGRAAFWRANAAACLAIVVLPFPAMLAVSMAGMMLRSSFVTNEAALGAEAVMPALLFAVIACIHARRLHDVGAPGWPGAVYAAVMAGLIGTGLWCWFVGDAKAEAVYGPVFGVPGLGMKLAIGCAALSVALAIGVTGFLGTRRGDPGPNAFGQPA